MSRKARLEADTFSLLLVESLGVKNLVNDLGVIVGGFRSLPFSDGGSVGKEGELGHGEVIDKGPKNGEEFS